jgi:hypothetical protein
MVTVQVPAHWVGQNYLPPICARHGGPATSFQQRKFYSRAPLWSYLLLPLGLLLFAIVTLAIRTTVPSRLPTCGQCSADRRRFIAGVISLWVATVGVIVLGIVIGSDALVLLGFLAIVLDLIACFTGDYFRVGGHVSQDRAWVNLKGVDDSFAATINSAVRPVAPVAVAAAIPYQPSQAYQPSQPFQASQPYQPDQATQNILPGQ